MSPLVSIFIRVTNSASVGDVVAPSDAVIVVALSRDPQKINVHRPGQRGAGNRRRLAQVVAGVQPVALVVKSEVSDGVRAGPLNPPVPVEHRTAGRARRDQRQEGTAAASLGQIFIQPVLW